MIFVDPNATTINSMLNVKTTDIVTSLKRFVIAAYPYLNEDVINLFPVSKKRNLMLVTGYDTMESDIPPFVNPVHYKEGSGEYLAMDVRPFVKINTNVSNDYDSVISVKNNPEFTVAYMKLVFQNEWLDGNYSTLLSDFQLAADVYATWISENVTRKFGLDPKAQLDLKIIAYVFYYSLFKDDVLDGSDRDRVIMYLKNSSTMSTNYISELVNKLESMSNINDFCQVVTKHIESSRLASFNLASLLVCVNNTWFGYASKENIHTAIEHPPTWLSLVYSALNERSFKRANISDIALRLSKRGAGDEFNQSAKTMTMSYRA